MYPYLRSWQLGTKKNLLYALKSRTLTSNYDTRIPERRIKCPQIKNPCNRLWQPVAVRSVKDSSAVDNAKNKIVNLC